MNYFKNFWHYTADHERRQIIFWIVLTVALLILYVAIDSAYPLEKEALRYLLGAYVVDSILFLATFRQAPKIGNAVLIFLTIFILSCGVYYFLLGYTVI